MNLIHDAWIPVDRQSGPDKRIAPWQVTDTEDPVLKLAAPRPDFNGALLQFLIGLLQTACTPQTPNDWAQWLDHPPTPDELRQRFEPFAHAFELDGKGPRFMQDFDKIEGEEKPISNLLIDAPGAQTLKQNADHFIKRGLVETACPSCIATALFTLQTNAPSGGVGHRTSLRGGGPLSTLVALDPTSSGLPDDLWRAAWLNVLDQSALAGLPGYSSTPEYAKVFPWLDHTRTSEKKTGHDTTPLDAAPLQMYWGMPRRIRVQWNKTTSGHCDLCGEQSDELVSHYITRNYGTNYIGAWQHPLSPHQISKEGEPLPRHAQPGGISYRHWLGLTQGGDKDIPALVITAFKNRKLDAEQLRMHVFGYDMDNMKARCWYESTFPLFNVDESIANLFSQRSSELIEAAVETSRLTRAGIKDAWFKRPGDAKGDTGFLVQAFFDHTETAFFSQLRQLKEQLEAGEDGRASLYAWHKVLRRTALELFDYWTARGDFESVNPRRIAEARNRLGRWLNSETKGLANLLGITVTKEKAA